MKVSLQGNGVDITNALKSHADEKSRKLLSRLGDASSSTEIKIMLSRVGKSSAETNAKAVMRFQGSDIVVSTTHADPKTVVGWIIDRILKEIDRRKSNIV